MLALVGLGGMRYAFVGIYFCLLVAVAKIAHSKKVKAIESHGEIKVGIRTMENDSLRFSTLPKWLWKLIC